MLKQISPSLLELKWCYKCILIWRLLFVYTTNYSSPVENVAPGINPAPLSADRLGQRENYLCLTLHIHPFLTGRPAAVDPHASPKCCHTGAGPPNRYEITRWSYQWRVSQPPETHYFMHESVSGRSMKHITMIMMGGTVEHDDDDDDDNEDDDSYFCVLRGSCGRAAETAAALTGMCSAGDHTHTHT